MSAKVKRDGAGKRAVFQDAEELGQALEKAGDAFMSKVFHAVIECAELWRTRGAQDGGLLLTIADRRTEVPCLAELLGIAIDARGRVVCEQARAELEKAFEALQAMDVTVSERKGGSSTWHGPVFGAWAVKEKGRPEVWGIQLHHALVAQLKDATAEAISGEGGNEVLRLRRE